MLASGHGCCRVNRGVAAPRSHPRAAAAPSAACLVECRSMQWLHLHQPSISRGSHAGPGLCQRRVGLAGWPQAVHQGLYAERHQGLLLHRAGRACCVLLRLSLISWEIHNAGSKGAKGRPLPAPSCHPNDVRGEEENVAPAGPHRQKSQGASARQVPSRCGLSRCEHPGAARRSHDASRHTRCVAGIAPV
jgi:hypothetical protein